MATMYDAVAPSSIPSGVPAPTYVAGYIDGAWRSYAGITARFPNAIPVSITVSGTQLAQVADCENGDLTPVGAANWAKAKLVAGVVPTVYCSEAAWPSVKNACAGVGPIDWWIAGYPGSVGEALYPGSVAHQWIDRGTYDESVVLDGWKPGRAVAAPPPSSSTGTPFGEDTMQAVPFSLTTNAAGKMDIGIPLPPGTSKVIAVSVDVKAAEAAPAGVWDDLVVGQPAVNGTNAGEIVVYGAPNHFYTGHAICA
jgi:hypothetical protein